jgi:hypothetical protein
MSSSTFVRELLIGGGDIRLELLHGRHSDDGAGYERSEVVKRWASEQGRDRVSLASVQGQDGVGPLIDSNLHRDLHSKAIYAPAS